MVRLSFDSTWNISTLRPTYPPISQPIDGPSLYQYQLEVLNLRLPLGELDADETLAKNQADRAKSEVELKTYINNMIKETIRVCLWFTSKKYLFFF